jgi:hypothetical protein
MFFLGSKIHFFYEWGGGNDSTPNVFSVMYFNALSIYIFEILNFNIINIWFINILNFKIFQK